ncbi:MAG: channel protein TolC [Dethiosulfovibrio peptidovorans]|nr:MAG: channel protein TolC [Dethiosulfovibrio peptidovorans]
MKKNSSRVLSLWGAILVLGVSPLWAVQNIPLDQTVEMALQANPEVQARWHVFHAATYGREAAKAGYRPKLALRAGVGRDNLDGPGYAGRQMHSYNRSGVFLSLSQMIYDGGVTKNEVRRMDHTMKMRYFELLDVMEVVALGAIRGHEDVLRYTSMVELARENLERHHALMDRVIRRETAGVGSAVDLETAKGRLALARVNLATELSNLHDARSQYLRIVGKMPGEFLKHTELNLDMSFKLEDAGDRALETSPKVFAACEHELSTLYALKAKKGALSPRLDFRASGSLEDDVDGTRGRRDKAMAELVLSYNIYDGGRDREEIRRFDQLHEEAKAHLKKARWDVRQAASIAYNDVISLQKKLPLLEQHKKSAEAMRKAYAIQFEVGRRSLLDLLDAENEAFQAQRSYSNAVTNLNLAKAQFLSEQGLLLRALSVQRDDVPTPEELGLKARSSGEGHGES